MALSGKFVFPKRFLEKHLGKEHSEQKKTVNNNQPKVDEPCDNLTDVEVTPPMEVKVSNMDVNASNIGNDNLKTPHMKKIIDQKNKQIHGVLDGHHGKVVKLLQKTKQEKKKSLAKAIKSLEPLCKEINEESKTIEEQHEQFKKLIQLLENHATFVVNLKKRQLQRISFVQALMGEMKQELDALDDSDVKNYKEMASQLQEHVDKAINQMTVENAKVFIEKFCNTMA